MIRLMKNLINDWRMIRQIVEGYEDLDHYVNDLDVRVFELESTISRLHLITEIEYEDDCEFEDIETPREPTQLTIYEYIDELPF